MKKYQQFLFLFLSLVIVGTALVTRQAAAQSLPPDCVTIDLHTAAIPALQRALYMQRQTLQRFVTQVKSKIRLERHDLNFIERTQRRADDILGKELRVISTIPRPIVYCYGSSCRAVSLADRAARIRELSGRIKDLHVLAAERYAERIGQLYEIDYALSALMVVNDALDYFPPSMHRCRTLP